MLLGATVLCFCIIIEDVDRMLERTTNVLLKEIEEPAEHCIWLLCAPSAQDVLPTIRSRTRIVNLAVPQPDAVAQWLERSNGIEASVADGLPRGISVLRSCMPPMSGCVPSVMSWWPAC